MSAIRFHFGEGPILQVRGPERAAMGLYVQDCAIGAASILSGMGSPWDDRDTARLYGKFLGLTEPQMKNPPQGLAERLAMSAGGARGPGDVSWKGKEIDIWTLSLNTALAVGSDPLRLAAKIYGTCEIHGFFEGKDRQWLAGLIMEGMEDNLFRRWLKYSDGRELSTGWTELIAQLRRDDTEPVVMSFTVTDGFPCPPNDWRPDIVDTDEDEDARLDAWCELHERDQFHLALADVRKRPGQKPISPETLRAYRFGHGLSFLDLRNSDIEKIEKSLGLRE